MNCLIWVTLSIGRTQKAGFDSITVKHIFIYPAIKCVSSLPAVILLSQDWLTESARLISKSGHTVEWVTPLGLPIIQPYHRTRNQMVSRHVLVFFTNRSKGKIKYICTHTVCGNSSPGHQVCCTSRLKCTYIELVLAIGQYAKSMYRKHYWEGKEITTSQVLCHLTSMSHPLIWMRQDLKPILQLATILYIMLSIFIDSLMWITWFHT